MSLLTRLRYRKANSKQVEIQTYGEVYSIAFTPDARQVVSGGQSKTIGRWEVQDGRGVPGEPMEEARYLLDVAVSKDGRWVTCGGTDGLAAVWDLRTHRKVVELSEVGSRVCAVDVSPDSTRFATGANHNVGVWSISTGRLLVGPLRHGDAVAAVKFSPGGERLATATWEQNSIRLYDSANGELLVEIPDRVSSPYNTALAWSVDGRQLFVASHAGKLKCFHVSGSFLSWTEWDAQADNQPVAIALAPNGKFVVSASSRFVTFWDASTHARIGPVIKHAERIWSVALSNDGHLAAGGDDKKIVLRNLHGILPKAYLTHQSDSGAPVFHRPTEHEDSLLADVHRLETLLGERDAALQDTKMDKERLEQTIHTLSATVHQHEANLAELKQEISKLKATVHGLRKQLAGAQGSVHSLSRRLNQTSEEADLHKREADRIKIAFDQLKFQHETVMRAPPEPQPRPDPAPRGLGLDGFASWMRDHPSVTRTPDDATSASDHNALACCAFVEARSGNWTAAYADAQKSVSLQPSAIGHIAKAVALVGQRDFKAAMRAFALVFRDGDPSENELMLVIWAVLSCLSGEYIDGILRVHDLVSTRGDEATHSSVQAYMYLLLGNRYFREGDYDRAIQLFDHARPSYSSTTTTTTTNADADARLELISLISGWQFDELESTARHGYLDALQAAGRTDAPAEVHR